MDDETKFFGHVPMISPATLQAARQVTGCGHIVRTVWPLSHDRAVEWIVDAMESEPDCDACLGLLLAWARAMNEEDGS